MIWRAGSNQLNEFMLNSLRC